MKPVRFLQCYHHITVLLYCWNSYVTESAAGLYFVAMNYSVHAIMYFYFFAMTAKIVPKWFPAQIITFFQISQMIVDQIKKKLEDARDKAEKERNELGTSGPSTLEMSRKVNDSVK